MCTRSLEELLTPVMGALKECVFKHADSEEPRMMLAASYPPADSAPDQDLQKILHAFRALCWEQRHKLRRECVCDSPSHSRAPCRHSGVASPTPAWHHPRGSPPRHFVCQKRHLTPCRWRSGSRVCVASVVANQHRG